MTTDTIDSILAQLTLAEKVSLLSGRDSWATNAIPRLNVPSLIMTDGPHGVRSNTPDAGRPAAGPTTAFPTGVSFSATWNPELVEEAARALGEETKGMGCDILLGPCVNIVRTPLAGRNFESYGEDPYLTGRIGTAYVKGLQSAGVGASLKHYAANNQETERFRGSSEVDERTLREIYLPHFETVVKEAEPWTVMCSYNRLNGVYASQHHQLLTEILKEEWGFEGVVVSDWTANHTITESVEGGLDLEMPGPARYYGQFLVDAVRNWQIEEEKVDEAARRVLRMVQRSGKLDGTDSTGAANTPEHQALARRVAEEAITLLKNDPRPNGRALLPLDPEALKQVAVIGPAAADMAVSGGGSAYTVPPHVSTPLYALRESLGQQVELSYERGADNFTDLPAINAAYLTPAGVQDGQVGLLGEYFSGHGFSGQPALSRVDPRLDFFWFSAGPITGIGASFSARWTGTLRVPESGRYTFHVTHTGTARIYLDDQAVLVNEGGMPTSYHDMPQKDAVLDLEANRAYKLRVELVNAADSIANHIRLAFAATPAQDDRIQRAAELARTADVAMVFVGATEQWESEGFDRPHMRLPGRQDELIEAVAAANPNTVVVLNTGAAYEMPWIERVASVVQAYFPGLEGGAAVMRVLTGEVNPSGKLTATYPVRLEDTASYLNLSILGARQVHYGEGLFVGYRFHDKVGVRPLFPFGHGLSYTTFAYDNLRAPAEISLAHLASGGTVEVTVDVTNTGPVAGAEVVQLYVHDQESSVARPFKELKGFAKLALQPGETKTARFTLDLRSFAYYDVIKQGWTVEPGAFELYAAASAEDVRASALVRVQ